MTYMEIYQIVKNLVPTDLREKYDHLSYGEMAEVAELSQWAEGYAGQRRSGKRLRCRMNLTLMRECKAAVKRDLTGPARSGWASCYHALSFRISSANTHSARLIFTFWSMPVTARVVVL